MRDDSESKIVISIVSQIKYFQATSLPDWGATQQCARQVGYLL